MSERIRLLNDTAIGKGPVVYWCTSARRASWNHALDHAVQLAREHDRGLLVYEGLRCDHPYASRRFHQFVLEGMQARRAEYDAAGVTYVPHIESEPGDGKAMFTKLASKAGVIVADDHPGFFYPRMLEAASRLPVRMEAVDSVGLLPMSVAGKAFPSAYVFRRFLQKHLPERLQPPNASPLEDAPGGVEWPAPEMPDLESLPIDHAVGAVETRGDTTVVDAALSNMDGYLERNHPDANAQTGLSPYLHFGHVGSAEVVFRLLDERDWNPGNLGDAKGQREGWWGLDAPAEAFLDQIITWRELGHVEARYNPNWMSYDSLPAWAQATLSAHEVDRTAPYDLPTLEAAETEDPVWNAAQRQLTKSGAIHNYLRMLWGKKILEWAPSSQQAIEWMLHLNDKYALDGRDPNSVSGIFWCLGRYDRAWQEREVFGKVRCMTSQSTLRKLRMKQYLETWSAENDA